MAKKNQQSQDDETVDLVHRELMEEEGLDESNLPKHIRDLLEEFEELEESYSDNATQEAFIELQKLDAKIADKIQTFIEDETEDTDEDENSNQSNQNQMKEKQKNADAEKAKAEQEAKANLEKAEADKAEADRILAEEAYKKSPEALVEKIKAKLHNNRISNEDLSMLIGVEEADDDDYKIGNLTLKRVFLGDGAYEVKS